MGYTDEEYHKTDPELEEIFKKRGIPKLPLPTLESIPVFRKNYSRTLQRFNSSPFAQKALDLSSGKPTWTEKDTQIPMRDDVNITLRIYVPNNLPHDGAPVGVVDHAGGWFMGDLETDSFICQLFCARLGLVMVNIDYRRYPEVKFPVPIEDCYDALKWTAHNIQKYGGNPSKGFIVGGVSGGGTFASIATHLARDDKLYPALTGCFLLCPIISDEKIDERGERYHRFGSRVRSPKQNENAPLMTKGMGDSIGRLAQYDYTSPLLTPFNFNSHKDVCPTYIQVCGLDPWRDPSIVYGEELAKLGVDVKLDAYPGLPHCWWTTFWTLKANELWLKDVLNGMKWLLGKNDQKQLKQRL